MLKLVVRNTACPGQNLHMGFIVEFPKVSRTGPTANSILVPSTSETSYEGMSVGGSFRQV